MSARGALIGLALLLPGVAAPQGVPIFDAEGFARRAAILSQGERDLAIQRNRAARAAELLRIEEAQLAALRSVGEALSAADTDVAGTLVSLEGGGSLPQAAALYPVNDAAPGMPVLFGDASHGVERLIVEGAKATYGLPGVAAAGLSLVQWRCLLQALIWQESRFSVGARSPADAYGLTQIIPGTARQLGIYPAYYDDPRLQVEGGARYLAEQMDRFDGNVVHALAAYNAGPGRVIEYGGVPPFAETRHYVRVIPERYNLYLTRVGGVDALGTIDPALAANADLSLAGLGASAYGTGAIAGAQAAAARLAGIVERIGESRDAHEAIALNTYARAELTHLVIARLRAKAAATRPASALQVALAAAAAGERRFRTLNPKEM